VEEFPLDCNVTKAAIRAGYSPKTANEQAAQLLAKLSIREAIDAALRTRSARTQIDAD
jgi:phage terminase small subunit